MLVRHLVVLLKLFFLLISIRCRRHAYLGTCSNFTQTELVHILVLFRIIDSMFKLTEMMLFNANYTLQIFLYGDTA